MNFETKDNKWDVNYLFQYINTFLIINLTKAEEWPRFCHYNVIRSIWFD